MPVLVDGNNLLHHLPGGLRRREEVRRLTLELIRREALRIIIVFDGPPPHGTPQRELLGRLTVVYSGSKPADDVIMGSLPTGAGARHWSVVTDDLGLRNRARQQGAQVRSAGQWRSKLLAGQRAGAGSEAKPGSRRPDGKLSPAQVADWKRSFSTSGKRDDATPRPQTRTSSARRKKG